MLDCRGAIDLVGTAPRLAWPVVLCLVAALVFSACDRDPLPSTTSHPSNTATPISKTASTPGPTPIPQPTPMPEPTPAPTPEPTPAPTPELTPTPTPTPADIVTGLLPPTDSNGFREAISAIAAIWKLDAHLGVALTRIHWVADHVTVDESSTLRCLAVIAELDLGKL